MAAFTFMGQPQGRNPFGFNPSGLPDPSANQSVGQIYGTAYQQPGVFAGGMANTYGTYGGGLAGLGGAMSNAYGAYAQGLGGLAQGIGSDASARAMAEAARQGAAGNIAAAALGNYGGAANSALAAWSSNQAAYQKALADMTAANQGAVSNFGQSRSNAIGQYGSSLAGAYGAAAPAMANLGSNLGAAAREDRNRTSQRSRDRGYSGNQSSSDATVGGNFDFGGMGGMGSGFQATGPDGPIASGTYGSSMGGGGGGGGVSGGKTARSSGFQQNDQEASQDSASYAGPGAYFGSVADRAYGGMGSALAGLGSTQSGFYGNVRGDDVMRSMSDGYGRGLDALNLQQYSSRDVPRQMLGDALLGMTSLGQQGYDSSSRGMDQFYGSLPSRDGYGSVLAGLGSGFGATMGGIGGLGRDLGAGYQGTMGGINNMWDRTLGTTEPFKSDTQKAEEQRAIELYNRRNRLQDRLADFGVTQAAAAEPYPGYYEAAKRGAQQRLDALPFAGRVTPAWRGGRV